MKKIIIVINAVLILFLINSFIISKELTIKNGKTVLLRLAPRDPRSLMQGDYMILRYDIPFSLFNNENEQYRGKLVITLDSNNIANFKRIYKGEKLSQNEFLLSYKNKKGISFGAEAFFFQEGNAKLYSDAKYGMLKIDKNGDSVLIGLCAKDFKLIKKQEELK